MDMTVWKVTVLSIFGICSFWVGRLTSYNNNIYIAHEALYHLDDDEYDFNALLIYFPFIIFVVVNVPVNSLIYKSIIDGVSLLLQLGTVYVYAYPICLILLTTLTTKKAIEGISCKRDYISSSLVVDMLLEGVFYLCIIILIYISWKMSVVKY